MTQKIIFFLAALVCLISIKWAYSHWDYEPILAIIASILQLLSLWKGDAVEDKISNSRVNKSNINIIQSKDSNGTISSEDITDSTITINQTK